MSEQSDTMQDRGERKVVGLGSKLLEVGPTANFHPNS
jgi:hypothetical protein